MGRAAKGRTARSAGVQGGAARPGGVKGRATKNSVVIRSVHNARVPMSRAAKAEALALIRAARTQRRRGAPRRDSTPVADTVGACAAPPGTVTSMDTSTGPCVTPAGTAASAGAASLRPPAVAVVPVPVAAAELGVGSELVWRWVDRGLVRSGVRAGAAVVSVADLMVVCAGRCGSVPADLFADAAAVEGLAGRVGELDGRVALDPGRVAETLFGEPT